MIVHYHLRAGGVRKVIELAAPHIVSRLGCTSVVLLTGEAPDTAWRRQFQETIAPVPVQLVTEPAVCYLSEVTSNGLIPGVIRRVVCKGCIVWAHNLALGRNILLARELGRVCGEGGIQLIAHHHDWWCNNRWKRWPELRRHGFGTLRAVAKALLPDAPTIHHVGINRADARILRRHFPGRAHWLPDPCLPPMKSRSEISEPVWLMPCRQLRRKNVAEALLLTRWLRPEARLVVTGRVSSPDEEPYAQALGAAARQHRWPLVLGTRGKPPVAEFLAACEAVLLTSIQEGFGLPAVEAAAADRPLIARRLPDVAPDLAAFGFRFPQTYDELRIDPSLFDWRAEERRQAEGFRRWLRRLPRACRRWAGVPTLLACEGPQPVSFSRLTLTAQLEVLCKPVADSWRLCAPLNTFLISWKKRASSGSLQVAPWPRAASKWLGGPAFAERFLAIARAAPRHKTGGDASFAAQEEFIRAGLDSAHSFPLLW